jgi:DNA-binding transcriptional regulator YiaG
MSTNSVLRERLARLGPVLDADPPPSFSGDLVTLVLRRVGRFDKRITVARRLRAAGLTLKAAHNAISRLAEVDVAVCTIAEGTDIRSLARDLLQLDVRVYRERRPDADLVADVRTRHSLSQREFAAVLGIDLATLQNWEQRRNKPDSAALKLIVAFDAAPDVIEAATLEPVI